MVIRLLLAAVSGCLVLLTVAACTAAPPAPRATAEASRATPDHASLAGRHRNAGNAAGSVTLAFAGDVNFARRTRRLLADPAAARALEQALDIYRDIGYRGAEAGALNERGTLHRVNGDLAQAEGCHRQALELARAFADSWDEAHALAGLGRCALAADHATQAGSCCARHWRYSGRSGQQRRRTCSPS